MVTIIWYMVSLRFLSHIRRATVVASPICKQKPQTSHFCTKNWGDIRSVQEIFLMDSFFISRAF